MTTSPPATVPPTGESAERATVDIERCADQVHVGIACVLRKDHEGLHECPGPSGVAVHWK